MLNGTGDGSTNSDDFADALVRELPRLVHLATRLVRDRDQAEDYAQETIVGAWRRRDQLHEPAALSAWLRRSLVSVVHEPPGGARTIDAVLVAVRPPT